MLLSEEPAAIIRRTINEFNLQSEKHGVAGVAEMCSTLQEVRALRVRDAEETLRKLARQLHTLSSRHDELVSSTRHAAPHTDHASHIATLDTQKYRTAKAASDAEAEAERLAGQAAELSARLQELELQGVEGDEEATGRRRDPVDDEVLLRLKLYRSLGIDIERDGRDGTGEWTRAVVRNDRKADVHVVNLDKKVSRFFYANYFWQTL